jgi:AraC-like DNA-binding protein
MEIQSSYFSYLFALGIGQAVLLIAALLKSGQRKSLSRIFFLIILIIMGIEILYGLLYQTNAIFDFPHLLRINTFLVLAFGPCLYLSILFYYHPQRPLRGLDLLHFLPSLLTLVYFIPLFISPVSDKLEYLNIMFYDTHNDSLIFGGLRRIQQGTYLVLIIQILWSSRNGIKLQLSSSYFRPLFALFLLFVFMWCFDIYRYFFQFDFFTGVINTVLMSSLLLYLTIKLVTRESFFKESDVEKYASSGLSSEKEKILLAQIRGLFVEKKSYTDQSLTLSKLADQLNVPSTYISQVVNKQLGINFNDFVNEWRVKEAQSLLKNSDNHNLTLLFIAQSSGFKSSSAFNAAFKKITDTTPSQFRKVYS